jgi:hypothetical protein
MYQSKTGFDSYVPGQYHGGNNVYFKDGCPALMADGRFITYYNSSNELTEKMRRMNGFQSSNQFRTFMQTNGDLFMATEREYQIKNNTCMPTTACSEGFYNLWTKDDGSWANMQNRPRGPSPQPAHK